ncbi:MAG: putative porin [Candidatus Poribacteria bacterium]|nr:putative porin [Candidatus Poribacteria bacterium]
MKRLGVYARIIVFNTVMLLQISSADAISETEIQNAQVLDVHSNGSPTVKDVSRLAQPIWKEFFFADARFRQESIFQGDSPSRYRYRIRFRMGGNFPVHPRVNLGFRMVTGATDDPTTGNVDLDDYFSKKGFNLDRLFLRYSPNSSLTATIGKFANPFERVELVFHNDVQLEGAAQQFRIDEVGFISQVQANLGQFILAETRGGPDTNLFAGQLYFKGFQLKGLSFGAMLYEYRNEDNIAQAVEDGRLGGGDTNARVGAGTGTSVYPIGFRIIEGLAKYELEIETVPAWLLASYAQNRLADLDDTAYWLEVGVGPVPGLHRLRALYHYARVEQQSMISNYNNADIFNPNTHGHELKFAFPVEKNIGVELLYFIAKKIIESGKNPYQHKTRIQIKAKF